jgi:hypothetical protein
MPLLFPFYPDSTEALITFVFQLSDTLLFSKEQQASLVEESGLLTYGFTFWFHARPLPLCTQHPPTKDSALQC